MAHPFTVAALMERFEFSDQNGGGPGVRLGKSHGVSWSNNEKAS